MSRGGGAKREGKGKTDSLLRGGPSVDKAAGSQDHALSLSQKLNQPS